MRKLIFIGVAFSVVVAVAVVLRGQPIVIPRLGMQAPSVTPSVKLNPSQPEVIVRDVASPVRVSAMIAGDVAPGGVNLVRIGPDGRSAVVATLASDVGLGPGGFSTVTTFKEASTGNISLQLSVAFRGQLRRVQSSVFKLAVSTKLIALPPDPGDAGKASLAGIDSDGDGVRDDVERSIVFSNPGSERIRGAQTFLARELQKLLTATADSQALFDSGQCLSYVASLSATPNTDYYAEVFTAQVNTAERLAKFRSRTGTQVTFQLSSDRAKSCPFNVASMEN